MISADIITVTAARLAQYIIRCGSVSSSALCRLSLRPSPPPPYLARPPPKLEIEIFSDDAAGQDGDELYASHAVGFITLAPPLPGSLPSSSASSCPLPHPPPAVISSLPPYRHGVAPTRPSYVSHTSTGKRFSTLAHGRLSPSLDIQADADKLLTPPLSISLCLLLPSI